jgi:hypothetical protein
MGRERMACGNARELKKEICKMKYETFLAAELDDPRKLGTRPTPFDDTVL